MSLYQTNRTLFSARLADISTLSSCFYAVNVQKFFSAAILLLLFFADTAISFERYNSVSTFDNYFSKYTKRFFGPGMDWKIFKAQAVAESRLIANAKSHVGAQGIMQIMPKTFDEIQKKNPAIKGTHEQPRWNIAAGIWYDRSVLFHFVWVE